MPDIVLTIDPDDTSFSLHDRANGRRLMGFEAPVPETDSQWAFSADTEGERRANLRYRNRVITADVMLDRSTAALLEALENTLGQKVGKLAREGGELRFAYPTGTTITFNVLEASMVRTFDIADMAKFRARYEVTFICEPFGLGAEEDLGDNTETTLPCLIFTEATVDGDVPALGRLVIDDDSGVDQWWLTWGIQSRYYSSSANAALFYEAEGRTALGGSATAVGPSGASGGGSNVMRNTALLTQYQAILSTQAAGGGAHLSHVGSFRFYARIQIPTTNTGDVSLALEWTAGDYLGVAQNAAVTLPRTAEGKWVLVDLGIITVAVTVSGTQRWEGRILAKSTVFSDDVDIDYLALVPVDEGSGTASAVTQFQTATTSSGRDEFDQSAGALTGKTAAVGGTWAGAGDADDFSVETTGKTAQRTAVSDSSGIASGRFAISGVSAMTAQAVQIDGKVASMANAASNDHAFGVVFRYTDTSNFGLVQVFPVSSTAVQILAYKVASGSSSAILNAGVVPMSEATFYRLRVSVDVVGRVDVWFGAATSSSLTLVGQCQDSVFATGGTLASGKPGFYDHYEGSTANTRNYDNFLAFVPSPDAALYASQSLEVRHDRVIREDSGGTVWAPVKSYQGDYLLVPPSGAEARTARVFVKSARSNPFESDPAIDDISAKLFVTPRYLVVPQA